jgi:hypothetical protein
LLCFTSDSQIVRHPYACARAYVRSMGFGLGRLGAVVILRLRACEQRQTNGLPNGIQYGRTASMEIAMHCIRSACRTGCRWLHIETDRANVMYNVMLNRDQVGRSCARTGERAYVRTGRRASRHTYMRACIRARLTDKSQKVQPKPPKGRPPIAISSRFGRAVVIVKWVYYPLPPHVQSKYVTLLHDYRDTQHATDRSECRF